MEKVKIHQVNDEASFQFIANILKESSIPFYKMSADAGGAYGVAVGGNIEILVDKVNVEKAQELLKEYDL